MHKPVLIKIASKKLYVKNQIEIKAQYIAISKRFIGFNLRQKRISSTVVILGKIIL